MSLEIDRFNSQSVWFNIMHHIYNMFTCLPYFTATEPKYVMKVPDFMMHSISIKLETWD